MGKCCLCNVTKTFEHLGREVCERCFVRLIERRVQKGLGRVLNKGDKVLVVGDLADYFLKKSVKNLPLKITKRKIRPKDVSKYNKVVVELTMDDIDAGFLAGFFGPRFKINKNEKVINILQSITDEEAVRFSKIKRIKFKPSEKNKTIKDFLKRISEKHAEVRFNLLKNVKKMKEVL